MKDRKLRRNRGRKGSYGHEWKLADFIILSCVFSQVANTHDRPFVNFKKRPIFGNGEKFHVSKSSSRTHPYYNL